jgi:hypothetical protein
MCSKLTRSQGISWVESTASSLEGIRIIKTWPGPAREADVSSHVDLDLCFVN